MYDAVIIGAGVVGAMTARALAKYDLKICVLERDNDVATGATKANSAIVHAGFDAREGSLKARLNVRGSEMMENIAKDLGVKYRRNGSLVVGFDGDDRETIETLYERGVKNGVKGLKIIDKRELEEKEPHVSENALCALYAPSGAIICPYELTVAAIGNAMDNGAELRLNFEVREITKTDCGFKICSEDDSVESRFVINAAGVYSDAVAAMVGDRSFRITPRRGEYILLDKECGGLVSHTIFATPTKLGKGILVSPTVDGNLLTGPTAHDINDKEDKSTTGEGFAQIMRGASRSVDGIAYGKSITSFCGLRAVGDTGDFIINSPVGGFVNAAGIESPGLSASPAIAEYIVQILADQGLAMNPRSGYKATRKPMHYFRDASIREKNEIIKKYKSFGRIVCRCESVTEGEILEAIRTNPKPTDLDGVKRRTRAQMGRCQGGFCSPYIMDLLHSELNIPYEKITKSGGESFIVFGKTKGDGHND